MVEAVLHEQKSFAPHPQGYGRLYVVATPIGNLQDISDRVRTVLGTVTIVAAEDTRQTQKLLNHLRLTTPLISFHMHSPPAVKSKLVERLKAGDDVALVSDAGTPAISDPGYALIEKCTQEGIAVIPVPGANAALTALVASGLPTDHFLFLGFLPRTASKKEEQLRALRHLPYTLILYEAPHRLKETLHLIVQIFGERKAVLARELTKVHEHFLRGTLHDLLDYVEQHEVRGELTLLIAPAPPAESREPWREENAYKKHLMKELVAEVEALRGLGIRLKEAVRIVGRLTGTDPKMLYRAYHGKTSED
ncbi:MAG: 16S rRNA (cytidine(1402)-2'-O)-methyltransferase [Candidatus Carbobacillus altaicus]|uniref:Ribosomal RNA small subunit methyltransferase I n=1 Tax=Candidatus Carbonibacillus altaicus TaxID=2163959 RepID=A0A2R6Y204_9BACL|nr:16S rRNA (cytidine(1402)-2'-O)-methyltransferase [Candidatus Carbobacillus altaicus]PTQ56719.1 MAG: rRNA small subunit methyltransferase I [Candidatus Carbobacillus altaicus]